MKTETRKTTKATSKVTKTGLVVNGKKVSRTNGNGHFDDDAHAVSKATGGEITTLMIRFLRAMRANRGRDDGMTRVELKAATHHWPNRKGAHIRWVAALRSLTPKLVRETEHEPESGNTRLTYSITAAGLKALEKAEAAAKATGNGKA